MTTKVFKYHAALDADVVCFTLPQGAELLHFHINDDEYSLHGLVVTLWARVTPDPDAPTEVRKLRVAGTGHPLDETVGKHLATLFVGPFVFHVFEMQAP